MTDVNSDTQGTLPGTPPARVGRVRAFVQSEWFVPVFCAFVVPVLSVTGVIIYILFFLGR
jgi:hypothetical protein